MKTSQESKHEPPRPLSDEPIVFGRVVAEREYRIGSRRVLVQVGTPHRALWKTDWYCPFRIVSERKKEVRRVFGLDAFQALMLAFDIIKASTEALSPKVRWEGSERPGDVGISKRLPTGLGSDFTKYLEQWVSDAYLDRARQLEREKAGRAGLRGGLLLPASQCRKLRRFFDAEEIVLEERQGDMVFARFPAGTKLRTCSQVSLPSGTQIMVAVSVVPGSGRKGHRVIVVSPEEPALRPTRKEGGRGTRQAIESRELIGGSATGHGRIEKPAVSPKPRAR